MCLRPSSWHEIRDYPDNIRESLAEARFKTLESLVEKASTEKCDIFIVAGDLFDRISVAKGDIARAAQTLGEFQGQLVTVLPGNHDYIEPTRPICGLILMITVEIMFL